ncbi:tetratricopeptide repeat protein [Neomegalonema perideroedes]|uniref:tetratricopeptide repeat protein n=1 Tax=Neomegalonema perideroedes TaxID=217219 RepID=UPI00037FA971|nr:tetratricopeptide repeat protein [Neomegalonema perideroedes]
MMGDKISAENGGVAFKGDGNTIIVGFTIEQHKAILKERLAELREQIAREHGKDLQILEHERSRFERNLADLNTSYQAALKRLEEMGEALRRLSDEIPQERLKAAYEALNRGDSSEADKIFAEIRKSAVATISRAAEAAYQQGRIAYEAIRWREARADFDDAHRLEPENELYIYWAARLARATGDYIVAEPLYRLSLQLAETNHGAASSEYAAAASSLAGALEDKGEYAAAEPWCRLAIDIGERTLGSSDPILALRFNNLANLRRAQGDLVEAETLYRRTLEINEKVLGPDHPDLAKTLNNLAGLIRTKGDIAAAEPLYRRAIAIGEKAHGRDHPEQATRLNNLAFLLQLKDEPAGAELLYLRAITIAEDKLGPDHPQTQKIKANYARFKSAHP